MILVTRLNGPMFGINPDLIERAEATPDTVVTLVDGTKYVVTEPVVEIIARIRDFRASVIATAQALESEAALAASEPAVRMAAVRGSDAHGTTTTVVSLPRREI